MLLRNVVIAHGGNLSVQGGGTNRVLAFARTLDENGYEVTLVTPRPSKELPELPNSIKVQTVPIKPKSVKDQLLRGLLVSLKAKKIARKENATLQIEHSTLGGMASLLGCSDYVLDVHDLEFDGDLYRSIPMALKTICYLEKRAVKKARKIIVVSEEMGRFISDNWNVDEGKIEVIPNGVREKILDFKETNEETEGLISFLGVLTHNVDYEKIIRLANELMRVKIYVIGDGPMRSDFLEKLEKEKVDNVVVPGYLPDEEAYEILASSQVCINPRRNDFHTQVSCGIKNFDYAALGKAIATDRDGTAVIFERNEAALVSDPANTNEFVENVKKLLEDANLRKKLGDNAKNLVKDFTWIRQGEKLVEVYKSIFNNGR